MIRKGVTAQDRAYAGMRRLATAIEPGDSRSLPRTLDALVGCAVEASGAVAGAMYLLDADRSLRLAAGHGLEKISHAAPGASGVHMAPAAAYAAVASRASVLNRGSPLHVCVPLRSSAAVLGVLCCHCPEGAWPGPLELTYLSLVAAHASSAVDTARARAAVADEAAKSERRRLVRELHESVSQSLYSIGLGARTARELLGRDAELAHQTIDQVLRLAETGLVQLRALAFDPIPDGLAEKGLVAALAEEIAAAGTRYGLATHAALGPEPPAPTDVKRALYRIAREALRNIARHACAGHITARLERATDDLTLEIIDDGVGFDATAFFPGHFGLTSMREWIADAGGELDITSAPGRGTRIRARAPVRPGVPLA